jgi:predicted acyltransferase
MTSTSQQRFSTLDVFRGMTVFLMIIVNTPGSGAVPYSFLEHAEWNGCTLTDLVFPSFLFAVGNAMPFAMKKWDAKPNSIILWNIFKRSILLFVIGYLLTWYTTMHWVDGSLLFSSFDHLRIMAVLQRIGLCYLIAALIVQYLSVRMTIGVAVFFLLGYWMLLQRFGDYTIDGNVVRRIDLALLGAKHMYIEKGIVFDPEGLLSTIPAVVNVLAGYLTGIFIRQKGKSNDTILKLVISGAAFIGLSLLWNNAMPFNKKLWTSSFVLFTSGIDMVSLGILFYFIEMKSWTGLVVFFSPMGKNPLFIYILSNLFLFFIILPVSSGKIFIDWINDVFFQKVAPGSFGALLFALSLTFICWTGAWLMNKKKIYIRI